MPLGTAAADGIGVCQGGGKPAGIGWGILPRARGSAAPGNGLAWVELLMGDGPVAIPLFGGGVMAILPVFGWLGAEDEDAPVVTWALPFPLFFLEGIMVARLWLEWIQRSKK